MKAIKLPAPTEHDIQAAYFQLVRLNMPGTKLIYAVPNGINIKSFATRVKYMQEGRVPGVPDVNIDYARGGYHGMRIEFKRDAKKKPSEDQVEAMAQLTRENYLAELHHDVEQAWQRTRMYLRGEIVK